MKIRRPKPQKPIIKPPKILTKLTRKKRLAQRKKKLNPKVTDFHARQLAHVRNAVVRNKPFVPTVYISKTDFVKALVGTGGRPALIAQNLVVAPTTIRSHLMKPDWEDMRELVREEEENAKDVAYGTLLYAMRQRMDISTAAANARWFLSKLERKRFGDDSKVIIEGGENPIRTQNVNLDVLTLDLPIEAKRAILEAIDAKENETKRKALGLIDEKA